jgi:4'-phosphopantetheinyl transferase EntD
MNSSKPNYFVKQIENFTDNSLQVTIWKLAVDADLSEMKSHLSAKELLDLEKMSAPTRIEEYLCARLALKKLFGPHSFHKTKSGQPQQVSNYKYSLSHKNQLIAISYSDNITCQSVAVDLELLKRVNPGILKKIATPEEYSLFNGEDKFRAGFSRDVLITAMIFSCKETLFKLLNPLAHVFFGFEDAAVVALETNEGSYTLSIKTLVDTSEFTPKHSKYLVTCRWISVGQEHYCISYASLSKSS